MTQIKELSLRELDLLTNEEVIEYHYANAYECIKTHEKWNEERLEFGDAMYKEFLKLDSNYKLIYKPHQVGCNIRDQRYNVIDEVTKDFMYPQIEFNDYSIYISAHKQKWQLSFAGPHSEIDFDMKNFTTSALVIHNKIKECLAKNK
jgi:hypothetical protein